MINTFLFDLDGTLLPMNNEEFEKEYFMSLARKFSSHFEPEKLIDYIWNSTYKMIKNTGMKKTNKEVFFEDFSSITSQDINMFYPIFDEFYNKEFKQLKAIIKPNPTIAKIIETLIDKGYEVVVATNPIFPMVAIKERINWAGLNDNMFKYITCFEEMHYCKPNMEFYEEVLNVINKKPNECIMVGNDVQEDLIASKLGIKTYLVENHMINRGGEKFITDYRGSYEDLYSFVYTNFPSLK